MRERVWGSPDVGRAPGCVRTQGTLPGSIWKRRMWRGVATQVRTHLSQGTQEMRRLRQDATLADQTQGLFLLMYIMMFYCLFQDNITGFNMCFPIRCLGFYGCLCIFYALFLVMIFLIIAPDAFVFTHIIWDLLGWISG